MYIKEAEKTDFDAAFDFIVRLWAYNSYDKEQVREVYERVLENSHTFAFFVCDEKGMYRGFCHGDYFDTFWMAGQTCYLSSLITEEEVRGKGYGRFLLDETKKRAKERGCKAVILDSGMPRREAHQFYEKYGFEKSCFGFELGL